MTRERSQARPEPSLLTFYIERAGDGGADAVHAAYLRAWRAWHREQGCAKDCDHVDWLTAIRRERAEYLPHPVRDTEEAV